MIRVMQTKISEFAIPLKPPLVVATGNTRREFKNRNGLYLILRGDCDGNPVFGISETVEPVFTPHATPDSMSILGEACIQIQRFASVLTGKAIDIASWIPFVREVTDGIRCEQNLAQALTRYALEQALLVLVAEATGISLHLVVESYIFGHIDAYASIIDEIKMNSLLNTREPESDVQRSHRDARTLKIKVGSKDPEHDACFVNQIASAANRSDRWLRLDANKMWTLDDAVRFFKALDPDTSKAVEYIEEPFKSSSPQEFAACLEKFTERTHSHTMVIALDESLLHENSTALIETNADLRIVHKTSLHSLRMNDILLRFGARTTITCTFETGVGLAFLCCVAAAVNNSTCHGIHPLPAMLHADDSTKKFSSLLRESDGEVSVRLAQLNGVRKIVLDSLQ